MKNQIGFIGTSHVIQTNLSEAYKGRRFTEELSILLPEYSIKNFGISGVGIDTYPTRVNAIKRHHGKFKVMFVEFPSIRKEVLFPIDEMCRNSVDDVLNNTEDTEYISKLYTILNKNFSDNQIQTLVEKFNNSKPDKITISELKIFLKVVYHLAAPKPIEFSRMFMMAEVIDTYLKTFCDRVVWFSVDTGIDTTKVNIEFISNETLQYHAAIETLMPLEELLPDDNHIMFDAMNAIARKMFIPIITK